MKSTANAAMPPELSRSLWIAAATLITMGLTASLGFWQLSRAAEKQSLEDLIESRADLSPWTARELLQPTNKMDEGLHRPARLTGEWQAKNTVFLDNRPMGGRSGFIVVTPLQLNAHQAILVQRGWVPRNFSDRTSVPTIPTSPGRVTIEGRLAPPPSQLFELGQAEPGPIRQNVDLEAFAQETGLHLIKASLLQTGPPASDLQRDWPRFAAGVQKHYGYAFQWFAMCATVAMLYLWFQIISPRRKLRPHGTES